MIVYLPRALYSQGRLSQRLQCNGVHQGMAEPFEIQDSNTDQMELDYMMWPLD